MMFVLLWIVSYRPRRKSVLTDAISGNVGALDTMSALFYVCKYNYYRPTR